MDLHIVFHQLLQLGNKVIFKKFHKETDFQRRPFPVFRGESIECEHLDAHMAGGAHNGLHIGGAHLMPVSPFPSPFPGPPAIPVKDDGHMLRKGFLSDI